MGADPKPPKVIKDQELLRQLHLEWQECFICMATRYQFGRLSLHHIHKHPRDDVRGNLVMLCGDGVSGCHGKIEEGDPVTRGLFGLYLVNQRPDTMEYLAGKLGGEEQAKAWMRRYLHAPV